MLLGDFPLVKLDALPASLGKQGYQIWLWSVEEGAFDCPLEPLTQEFWQTNLESRLAYGIVLPACDFQKEEDLLVLVSQKLSQSVSRQFGRLRTRQRYQLFNFLMEIQLPNTEHLTSLHPFVRVTYFKILEEVFRSSILPIKDEKGKYRRSTSAGSVEVMPEGLSPLICPKCGQVRSLRGEGATLLSSYPIPEDDYVVRAFCVCETCEQVFNFIINIRFLKLI